ncbi:hypothetical protein KEM44_21025 [Sinorhizobium meliloti]|nr:hypothetical protein KEM44_21025 [Sinorhizobium meliloti]
MSRGLSLPLRCPTAKLRYLLGPGETAALVRYAVVRPFLRAAGEGIQPAAEFYAVAIGLVGHI